jgi:hypothetical protein
MRQYIKQVCESDKPENDQLKERTYSKENKSEETRRLQYRWWHTEPSQRVLQQCFLIVFYNRKHVFTIYLPIYKRMVFTQYPWSCLVPIIFYDCRKLIFSRKYLKIFVRTCFKWTLEASSKHVCQLWTAFLVVLYRWTFIINCPTQIDIPLRWRKPDMVCVKLRY